MKVKKIPDRLLARINDWDSIGTKSQCMVGGGFIRDFYSRDKPRDLDLFFRTETHYKIIWEKLLGCPDHTLIHTTEMATTFRNNTNGKIVQLIKAIKGTPEEVFDSFDFTVCKVVLDIRKKRVLLHDSFFEHLAGKVLYFDKAEPALTSLRRALRFASDRGYKVPDETMVKLARQISSQIDWADSESVKKNLAYLSPAVWDWDE